MALMLIFTYALLSLSINVLADQNIDPLIYLHKYGLLSPGRSSQNSISDAVKSFQNLAGLPPTGTLDVNTLAMMKRDRCGFIDNSQSFAYWGPGTKWRSTQLTYKFSSFTYDLNRQTIRDIMRQAYKVWSDVTPLTFTEISSGKPTMDIRFNRWSHGDRNSFDGKGGTLAHAFYPHDGRIHFDDDEYYIDGRTSSRGTSLFYVAAHEIGHAIGLSHDQSNRALMYAFHVYFGNRHQFRLPSSDVYRIQRLYGSGGTRPRPTIPISNCRDNANWCRNYVQNPYYCRRDQNVIKQCRKSCKRC